MKSRCEREVLRCQVHGVKCKEERQSIKSFASHSLINSMLVLWAWTAIGMGFKVMWFSNTEFTMKTLIFHFYIHTVTLGHTWIYFCLSHLSNETNYIVSLMGNVWQT